MIDATGTSFHGSTFFATPNQVFAILGTPDYVSNTGEDKINYEWVRKIDSGDVFTVYDWKEYRQIGWDQRVEWHIGGRSKAVSEAALGSIKMLLATTAARG
jgi:hypothetical protein